MKTLLLFVTCVFLVQCSNDLASPDGLALNVHEALKNQDLELFMKCYPPKDELVSFFSGSDSEMAKINLKEVSENYGENELDIRNDFIKAANKAKKVGIIWEETIYLNATYEITIKKENNLTSSTADVHLFLEYEDQKYKIVLKNCEKYNAKWYVCGGIKWKGAVSP